MANIPQIKETMGHAEGPAAQKKSFLRNHEMFTTIADDGEALSPPKAPIKPLLGERSPTARDAPGLDLTTVRWLPSSPASVITETVKAWLGWAAGRAHLLKTSFFPK